MDLCFPSTFSHFPVNQGFWDVGHLLLESAEFCNFLHNIPGHMLWAVLKPTPSTCSDNNNPPFWSDALCSVFMEFLHLAATVAFPCVIAEFAYTFELFDKTEVCTSIGCLPFISVAALTKWVRFSPLLKILYDEHAMGWSEVSFFSNSSSALYS